MKKKEPSALKKLWDYIWKSDSIGSYILNFILAFVIIKYLFFPGIGFVLQNDYPIVAIVSGSMEHKITNGVVCDKRVTDVDNANLNYDQWWSYCGDYYESTFDLSKEEFKEFPYRGGLDIGDVMVLYGKDTDDIEVGEILVFIPEDRSFYEQKGPVIHRVMKIYEQDNKTYFQTKGDHNPRSFPDFEHRIPEEDVIGVGVIKIPWLGYGKLLLNNVFVFITGGF